MGVRLYQQKTSGDWYVWINHKGQRTSRKIGPEKGTAIKAARKFREQLALGQVDFTNGRGLDKDNVTFGGFFKEYINKVAKHRLKRNSWYSYQRIAELYLLPEWKNKKLKSINRQEVKRLLLDKQGNGLCVQNIRICISAVFAEAVEREIVLVNPAHNLGRFFKKSKPQKKTQFLTKEQVTGLLDVIQKDEPDYYDLVLTAFRTGMRLGELVGLAWDSVNFDTKQIIVQRSYSHDHWDTPKSHKVRYIDMTDGLYKALKARHKARNKDLHCQSHKKKKICLVFPDREGEPINANIFRRGVFYKSLTKAKLPKIRVHDIRHTYASLLLQIGAPIHYVKEQLGHSSITMTVDLYGHCQPGVNRSAINQLD
ncbi:MAG: site-specific integrase [Phycisphaerae bacterium]|nr:site-specific integrase [Phycisphaerae bacterium]